MTEKKFKVYKSSAGSGKTFTLVSEFLRLVMNNPNNYRHILAITFTNKAANEMKSRIVKSLVNFAKPFNEWTEAQRIMIAPIREESGMSDETIRQRSMMVIANILHNYSDLSATTIDSFMQRVIRTFSLDLDLPHNYEVELDADMLRQHAVDRLIDMAGADKKLTDLLVHYLETKTEDDKSWRIEINLNEAAKSLFSEDGVMQREALKAMDYDDYRQYYGLIINWILAFEAELAQMGGQAMKLLNDNNLEISDFSYGKNGAIGYFLKLAKGRVNDLANPGARIQAAVTEGNWTKKNQSKIFQDKVERIALQLIDIYNDSQALVQASVQRYNTLKLLLKHLYPLAVLGSIENIIGQIREEERILPISEFNRIVAAVTQTETMPYIYERLGEKYHHMMIDEFQDTSLLQWQNLLPLVENALSENHVNLVVGDAKQAIYRWRSGEVDQFIALPRFHGDHSGVNQMREQALVNHYEGHELLVNWRSHKAIVEFNNSFFQHLSKRLAEPYQAVYDSLNQQYNPGKNKGLVQTEFFDAGDEPRQAMLERLPALIRELQSANYSLSDIAILCRTNNQGSEIARHLLANEICVISSDSLLLGYAADVRLVVCMLRIMADAADQLAYAEALALLDQRGIFGQKPLHELLSVAMLPESGQKRNKQYNIQAFESLLQQHGVAFSRKQLLHLPLYDMAEELIRLLGLSVHKDIYLQFFLNELHSVITRKFLAIKDLATWWEDKGKKVSVIFPDNLDAVKVSTIHKAKGLEFPVVIFPFATAGLRFTIDDIWVPFSDPMLEKLKTARMPVKSLGGTLYEDLKTHESDKSLLDLLNLLYVAFTRAEERLYVLTNMVDSKDKNKNSIPAFIHDFIAHTEPEYQFSVDVHWVFPQSVDFVREPEALKDPEVYYHLADMAALGYWKQKIAASTRSHGKWFGDEPETARGFGTAIHELLARISTREDLQAVLDSFVLSGEIQDGERERIAETLTAIVEHPKLQDFFSVDKNVLAEPDILLPGGEIYRPDRVLISESLVRIAEFKTGQPRANHKTQLARYIEILQKIHKTKVVGLLAYAAEGECVVDEVA
jgi:ATP-dependent exoDNAse (exonuclease V) beta subunit